MKIIVLDDTIKDGNKITLYTEDKYGKCVHCECNLANVRWIDIHIDREINEGGNSIGLCYKCMNEIEANHDINIEELEYNLYGKQYEYLSSCKGHA